MLYVDDDQLLLQTVAGLARGGLHVWTAKNGQEARAIARRTELDVAMIDLVMPGEHGFEVVSWLRQHYPHLAISVVTGGERDPDVVVDAITRGADAFMTKPFTLRELLDRLLARRAAQLKNMPTLDEAVTRYCRQLYGLCGRNKSKAARVADIGRATLDAKIAVKPT